MGGTLWIGQGRTRLNNGSRMTRECHVRFCESAGVRSPRATRSVLHCKSRRQAEYVLGRIRERFQACHLELHPGKTRIVYCKDINRTEANPDIQFTFLGYTFRPRKAVDKYGRVSWTPDLGPLAKV